MADFTYSTPCAEGIDPRGIAEMVTGLKQTGLHGFVLVRHGKIISEGWQNPYSEDKHHLLFSLTKSFTSIATGLAASEGLLSLDDYVTSFFDIAPDPCGNMKKMRVRHLLGMCTGHTTEPDIYHEGSTALRHFLESYVQLEPGSRFLYNTAASGILSYIIEKVAGVSIEEYLKPRLFEPLGISDYTWQRLPDGVHTGGFGLALRTRDIAKFGQLILQNGVWDSKQLVPAEYINEATRKQIMQPEGSSDWSSGYGYQFWINSRADSFRGDGAFGQYCIVFPKHDMILAANSGSPDMQGQLDWIFNTLVPAVCDGALPEDEIASRELEMAIACLGFEPVRGTKISHASPGISGKVFRLSGRNLMFETISVDLGDKPSITFGYPSHTPVTYNLRFGSYAETEISDENIHAVRQILADQDEYLRYAASSYAWDGGTLRVRMIHNRTPFIMDYAFSFDGNAVKLDIKNNVGFVDISETVYGLCE